MKTNVILKNYLNIIEKSICEGNFSRKYERCFWRRIKIFIIANTSKI